MRRDGDQQPGDTMLERAGVTLVGDHVRHIAVGRVAQAEISAVGFQREDIDINILSPSKVPVLYRWVAAAAPPRASLPVPKTAARRSTPRPGSMFRNPHIFHHPSVARLDTIMIM